MSDKNDAAASVSKEDVQGESNTQASNTSDANGIRLASVHGLKRQLKNRHAQMITIGKSINPPFNSGCQPQVCDCTGGVIGTGAIIFERFWVNIGKTSNF